MARKLKSTESISYDTGNNMSIIIRESNESDIQAISELMLTAFGVAEGKEISGLITDLFVDNSAAPRLSLAAVSEGKLVGYILFTHAGVTCHEKTISASILAPLAVHPAYQSQGIGGQLISKGLAAIKALGAELIFVLGYPGYYSRHGFSAAGVQGFDAPYPIPEKHADAWMVQAVRPNVIGAVQGMVVCAKALDDPKYWIE